RLEERLAWARLVWHRGEEALYPGSRRGGADAREQSKRAVGAAGFGQGREHEDDPLRPSAVVDERGAAQLAAVLLEVDPQASIQTEEPVHQAAPATDRATRKGHGKRRRDDPFARVQRGLEQGRDTAHVERSRGARRHAASAFPEREEETMKAFVAGQLRMEGGGEQSAVADRDDGPIAEPRENDDTRTDPRAL